jgi:Zn-dependent protease with chaperone function
MPFLLMLLLTLACLPDTWPAPGDWIGSPWLSVALTGGALLVEVALAWLLARRTLRLLAQNNPEREALAQGYSRKRAWHLLGLLGIYGVALYVLGWGWAVQSLWRSAAGVMLPAVDVVLLAPFLLALVLSWNFFYDVDRAFHDAVQHDPLHQFLESDVKKEEVAFWTRGGYLGFLLRQNIALVFIPVLLLMVEKETRRWLPGSSDGWLASFKALLGVFLAAAVFIGMPWILRQILGLRSLPAGPLRDRLEATARRLNFRCTDLLLWPTRGGITNAMVVGIVPFLRYVLFSDRLLDELSPDEIEAVFGHEVGHVKHRHMLYYLGFLLASMVVIGLALAPWIEELDEFFPLHERPDLAVVPMVFSLGAYIFLVFGFLSRRCERQADLYGCRAVSCTDPACTAHTSETSLAPGGRCLCPTGIGICIQALEKVAVLSGISRDRPGFLQSWQHSSIARRVEFLERVRRDPSEEPRFQRRVATVKWGLFFVLGLLYWLLAGDWPLWFGRPFV